MADAAGIAAITAGSTLVASAFGGTLSYLAAKRSTGAQLAGVEGEMKRLKITHEEAERQQRQDLYVEFLDVVNRRISVMGGAGPMDKDVYERQQAEFSHAVAKMLLFATESVVSELETILRGFNKAAEDLESDTDESESLAERARRTFEPHERDLSVGLGRLIGAMKFDLRGDRLRDELRKRGKGKPGSPAEGSGVADA